MERMAAAEFKAWLERRTREFAVASFRLIGELPNEVQYRVLAFQFGKAASSIGANYREANRAESRADFSHKLQIAIKEASESCYWLEILASLLPDDGEVLRLSGECVELRNLLQAIGRSVHGGGKSDNLKSDNQTIPTGSPKESRTPLPSMKSSCPDR